MTSFAAIRLPSLTVSKECADPSSRRAELAVTDTDECLLARICQKDSQALGELFHRYSRIVRGIAYRVLRDPSEADDLLQDIFLLIHRLCTTFDSAKGPARFWILQMTYRRAISRCRYLSSRHFFQRVDIDDVAERLSDSPANKKQFENSLEGMIGREKLQRAFEELSDNQRQALLLRFAEGYTLEQIAEKLGQSRANIKNHYFRGLERLRKQIFAGSVGISTNERHDPLSCRYQPSARPPEK